MPISMAEAGAERERERERKESRAMPLRERVENGEGETLRFGGSEERAITVDRKVAEEEQKGETTVDNGIVTACFCSATFVTLRGSSAYLQFSHEYKGNSLSFFFQRKN